MEEKPRISRLTAILMELQTRKLLTAREISEKYKVSIRTVYRDIRTLEQSGVPIVVEEGRGYSLMQGFNLPPVMFTQKEANALITAAQLIQNNKDKSFVEAYQDAIVKVRATLRNSQKEKIEYLTDRIVIRNKESLQSTSDYLMVIQAAIANFNVIQMEYKSLKGEVTKRRIESFALYSTQDNWLLIAVCQLRNDFRVFRLDCIQSLVVLDEKFEPQKMTLQEYFEECKRKSYTPDIPLS